jgi:cardiolipin synthase
MSPALAEISVYWPLYTLGVFIQVVLVLVLIPWIILNKREPVSALAWCMVVMIPLLGPLLFWVFGYQHVARPLRRKQLGDVAYDTKHPPRTSEATRGDKESNTAPATWNDFGRLALQMDAFPVSPSNEVELFHDTNRAFPALLKAIRDAKHHIHLEFFIIRSDAAGKELFELLTEKARANVEVRVLFDWMGTRGIHEDLCKPLEDAGGRLFAFLPLSLFRTYLQVNLRNHRKICVIDGTTAFTGGMNIGDEYLGRSAYFGAWRDSFLSVRGPAVAAFQRVFAEDWYFASQEALKDDFYFPDPERPGEAVVQFLSSGPDDDINPTREMFFAAVTHARRSILIASPYFVPDSGLLDALRLARRLGVDVQLLTIQKPDHFFSYYAGCYYWRDLLAMGAKVWCYNKGMMHSKILLVDGQWGYVGSANFDNRSLHLNFEAGCILHSPDLIEKLARQFEADLANATPFDEAALAARDMPTRLIENACRLLSPLL